MTAVRPGPGGRGPRRPVPWRRLARAAATAVALAVPVATLALLVRLEYGPLLVLDEAAIRAGTDLARSQPVLRSVLLAWETAFRGVWVNSAALLLCLWVWRRTGVRNRALWAFTTIMVSWGLALGLKYVIQRARPVVEEAVSVSSGFSFPSGHVANTTTAVLALTVLLWPLLRRRGRAVACAVGAALVLLTAADRILLGVHYPSDTAAGVVFAAAVVWGSYLGFISRRRT